VLTSPCLPCSTNLTISVLALLLLCRAVESQDYAGAVEAYTAALAVDPQHKHVNKELQLGLCRVQQQLGKAEEAVLVSGVETQAGWTLRRAERGGGYGCVSNDLCFHGPYLRP
jgi:predicted negative regulator of RcsB-dependent stress response